MEKFVPEVIVSHWVNPQLDLIIKLGEWYNAKTSLVFHGDCSDRNIEKFNLIENVKKLDAVGCRNETYANYVAEKLNLKKKPFAGCITIASKAGGVDGVIIDGKNRFLSK